MKYRYIDITEPIEMPKNNTDNETDVNILFAGSIFLNQKAYKSGTKPDETFNYEHLFIHITNDIKSVDLSIVELETVFHINTDEKKIVKKVTNTPKELGDAIANAGFKVVLHASN